MINCSDIDFNHFFRGGIFMRDLIFFSFIALLINANISATTYKIIEFGSANPPFDSTSHTYFYSADRINESGQVVGTCRIGYSNYIYLWDRENGFAYQSAFIPPNAHPCINNHGEISGLPINDTSDRYSIVDSKLTKNGIVIESSMKWISTYMLKVNNCGQIAGIVEMSPDRKCAVIFDEINKSIANISSHTKYILTPTDINDLGMVVGRFNNGEEMGFLWTPNWGIQYLKGFTPKAINNNGIIVGSRSPEIAVMWDRGILVDVADEIKLNLDFSSTINHLKVINDINDQNQMIGEGRTQNNSDRCVIILPINIPSK